MLQTSDQMNPTSYSRKGNLAAPVLTGREQQLQLSSPPKAPEVPPGWLPVYPSGEPRHLSLSSDD